MGRRLTGDDRTLDAALMLCRNAMTAAEMRMALSIVLPGRTKTSLWETAEIIGVSQSTLSRMRKKFIAGERPDLHWKSGWGGRRRGNMSEAKENRFIRKWAAIAEKEGIKTLNEVHMDYLRISGAASPKSTVHRFLKRNGWGKIKSENGANIWKMRK
jgi:hypothetical protein